MLFIILLTYFFSMNSQSNKSFSHDSSSLEDLETDSSSSECEIESNISNNNSSSSSSSSHRIFDESIAVELTEQDRGYQLIRQRFLSAMNDSTQIVSIHRRSWSKNVFAKTRRMSFQLYAKAFSLNSGHGGEYLEFGWCGGSLERIKQIFTHGFSFIDLDNHGAICLSADEHPAQSMEKSIPDERGVQYILLCRVLLERSELIHPTSMQTQPSSPEFDSGVDDLRNPTKYFIWSYTMNSHILPEFVVSFTTPIVSPLPIKSKLNKV